MRGSDTRIHRWRGRVIDEKKEDPEEELVVKIASFPYNYTKPVKPVLKMASNISPNILKIQLHLSEIQVSLLINHSI